MIEQPGSPRFVNRLDSRLEIGELEGSLAPVSPSTWSDVIVAARWRRGSLSFGRTTGYVVPRIATAAIVAPI
jgi:hypothetical protein